ncbi:MAG: hydroxyethylthiazole kinase [Lachnospiraceae bacterium]|nr:hydroxyethylthiazole kinase [Lachnospiraceae bacterium]
MLGDCIENLRKAGPLVHNITNAVTINDVANVILACGARPIMSDEPADILEVTSICDALNINMGQLKKYTVEGMFLAGKKQRQLGHPVVLDPVGVGASSFRRETATGLLGEVDFTVIRGNISEIRTLALGIGNTAGVDAAVQDRVTEETLERVIPFVKAFSGRTGSVIAVTGSIDLVSDSSTCYVIRNGRQEMGKVTGTGCMLSGMMAAFLAANPERELEAAAAAVCTMGHAGEIGWCRMQEGEGNASYRNRIIDAVYNMNGEILNKGAKYELR